MMEKMNKNLQDYRNCDLLMRKTQPIMKKISYKNKLVRIVVFVLLFWLPAMVNATLTLPAIPSNSNLAKKFELSTEMVFRVKVGENYLTSGALIAYINGEIRGAQTASTNFPATGVNVYKVLVFNDKNGTDSINFKYYDIFNDKIYDIQEKIEFTANLVPDYANPQILSAFCKPIDKVTGLLPENGKENVNTTLDLYWQPSPNTSYYNLYIWEDGASVPATPTYSNIYSTTRRVSNLKYGQLYRWKVGSVNDCSSVESPEQTFKVRLLPDLTIPEVNAPINLESGSDFNISFTVKNVGSGNTAGILWNDLVYVSSDATFSNDDKLLSNTTNLRQLEPDSSYTRTVTTALPVDYTGNYYFIVKTDYYNSVAELLDNNNEAKTTNATAVTLKTLPDILVKDIQSGSTNINPGDSVTVSWKVENSGGTTAIGGWAERISIVPVSGTKLTITQNTEYKDTLTSGSTINRSRKIKIPDLPKFSGAANIEVELIPFPALQEYAANKANNTAISINQIMLSNILTLDIQTTSILESSPLAVRCVVSRSGNFAGELAVSLAASKAGQVTIPASVVIPANQSSVIFNLNTINNTNLEGSRTVDITASAASFTNSVKTITILDDEIPRLSAVLSKTSPTEGETINLIIKRDLVTDQDLSISIATNKSNQLAFTSPVIIPANKDSVKVTVLITDDNIPELKTDATLYVSSAGVTTGEVTASIVDNDIPQVTFEILSDTVSESAGAYATWGLITRVKGDDNITVNLSQSPAGALFFPASVSLPKGVGSQKFNIGVVDNGDVDGYRKINMSGSIFISSCNCGTTPENGGIVKDSLVIADNDGPSLSISVFPLSLPEGKSSAGMLTISRNTPPDAALEVTITHNDPTEVSIQTTATIDAGQKSVQVPINTINDNIEDGNQMVSLQVSAPTFSSGFGYVFVTDLNKPDMEITDIQLNTDTVATNEMIEISGSALNSGFGTAPTGVKINFYYSKNTTLDKDDKLLGEYIFPSPILQSAAAEFIKSFEVPDETGKFFVLAKINPDQAITELAYFNNESEPANLLITPEYTVTAFADEVLYLPNTTITIHGSATNSKAEKVANVDVDVYILTGGTRRELKAKTNGSGEYSVDFVPVASESGHYIIGACFPKQNLSDEQDKFDIPGLVRQSNANIIWEMKMGQVLTGKIGIKNTSEANLNKLVITADKLPLGCELVFDTISSLSGNQTKEFNFTLKSTALTDGKDYEKINFQVKSSEGITVDFPAYYYCQALQAQLKTDPVSINTTMTKGKSRIYAVNLYNNGAGESGTVTISLPDVEWMTLLSPATIDNLAASDTIQVLLSLSPTEDTPLNTPISGNIAMNCVNGTGLSLPYRIEAVSEETGGLKVDVIDEYTYYTEAKPHVKNAHVVVRHPFSGKIVADGFTGDDGIFAVDNLPEGSYRMNVEAEKHEGFQTTLVIDPGRVNEQTVFLSFQAISYTWEVVPTEIEDNYEVQLVMKFETNVPVPVVVMEMPTEMPQLFNDETYTFLVTLTNKGLITAKDVELTLPQNDPEYVFETNFSKLNLLAQQAIQVPVVMKLRSSLKSASAVESTGPCTDYAFTIWGWECGKDNKWNQTTHGISFSGRVCAGSGGGGGWGWGGGWGGGGGPSRGGGGTTYYNPNNNTPTINAPTVGCDKCLIDVAQAVLGCLTLYPPLGLIINAGGCLYSAADGEVTGMDAFNCVVSFLPTKYVRDGFKCALGIANAAKTCYEDPPFFLKSGLKSVNISKMPPILLQSVHDLEAFNYGIGATFSYIDEIMGTMDWQSKENFNDFMVVIEPFISGMKPILPVDQQMIEQEMDGSDITNFEIITFAERWNRSLEAHNQNILSPTVDYPDIVNVNTLIKYIERADSVQDYTISRGFADIGEMYDVSIKTIEEQLESGRSSVCTSVTINITQKVVMTREAFEGTLTIYNGNKTTAMQEIKLDLEIKDENGVICNDLFQIDTKALSILTGIDGNGTLGADQKGSATVLFIPEKGAAPTVPKSYSFGGSFSYLDPFTNVTVTKPLFPVTLDVNPSPDLFLHYFMQRDILGDDALTEPIEPIVPAELAVMVQNNGYGTAKNVRIESAQPKIVENEKGLAVNFALVSSNLNGQPAQLGLTNINFGNIAPKTSTIGQWWFTSDLLGHFIAYETKLTHLDSRGNPDLSLISGTALHELIKSVRVYSGVEDNINDFLVNEVQDSKETPDIIFLSNGGTLDVYPAVNSSTTGSIASANNEIELLVTPNQPGWNYHKLDDPGNGNYKIISVTRSDGQIIPLDNVWQTHVTLPDGKEPVYENKIHFLDVFAGTTAQKYTVRFSPPAQNPPSIVRIENIPTSFVTQPLTSINVVFNKPIDGSTFNYEDMTLRVQGGADIMDATVTVTEINQTTFRVDLTSKTTLDGFYALNIQTAGIKDLNGIVGVEGKQANWTQFVGIPAISEFIGLPDNNVGVPFDLLLLNFNVPIDKTTLLPSRLTWNKDGSPVTGSITIIPMDTEGRLFQITGLQSFMTGDGNYTLTVDLQNIKSLDGINGATDQSVDWKIDQTPPTVSEIIPSTEGGYDSQHRTSFTVKFNEPVNGLVVNSLELWKDGQQQPISQLNLKKITDSEYQFTQFRMLTYYEGNYLLKLKMKDIPDFAGNSGTDIIEFDWIVFRKAPNAVTNLRITPDMGYSDTDAITATKNLIVNMTVNQDNSRILIYQTDQVNPVLLADTSIVNSGPLSLPITVSYTGNISIEAHCMDIFTNTAITKLPVFIDESSLTGIWNNVPLAAVSLQPDSLHLEFSEKLLDDSNLKDYMNFERNGQTLGTQNLIVLKSTDKLYLVTGLDLYGNASGIYSLTIDNKNLYKYSSGKQGVSESKAQWTIESVNKAPNANAGTNQTVDENSLVTLDGSASSDPDGDAITYLWTAPAGITLSSTTSANPTFTAPEVNSDQTFIFGLVVNDGKVNSTSANVNITVRNISGTREQMVDLRSGWNIFSSNVIPDNLDMIPVFQALIDDGSLVKVQDQYGNSLEDWFIFGSWTNNIGDLTIQEGYKVKVNKNSQLIVSGSIPAYPIKIPLKSGWNIVGYPQNSEIDAQLIVKQLVDRGTLIKVQDDMGNSYEDWNIFGGWTNNIGDFIPGKGYRIKVNSADTLTINGSYGKSSMTVLAESRSTIHFKPVFEGNGVDHMNINLVALPSNQLQPGDELAVYDGENCVGAVTLMPQHLLNQAVSIRASAADELGSPGFMENNSFTIKLWKNQSGNEFTLLPEIISGTSTFIKYETTLASLEKYNTTDLTDPQISRETIVKLYPNPFNDKISIEVNVSESTGLTIEIIGQDGSLVKQLARNKQVLQGIQFFTWNGTNNQNSTVASGIYYLRIKTDNKELHQKIVFKK